MKTFYFNTGVRPYAHTNPPLGLMPYQVIRGDTVQIPFDVEDVPECAVFRHASGHSEPEYPNWIVREIHNSGMCSKYAHFELQVPLSKSVAIEYRTTVQCQDPETGKTGCWAFTGDDHRKTGTRISPVFADLADLFRWLKVNGFTQVPGTLASRYTK